MTFTDPAHGEVRVLVATPREDDPWGVLGSLRGTPWGSLVREVSGEALAHARHGYATPLMREIGPSPKHLMGKISDKDGLCKLSRPEMCAGATPMCRPGRKLPDCYEPPGDLTPEASESAVIVSLAWRDGCYVVVVVGGEFSLI